MATKRITLRKLANQVQRILEGNALTRDSKRDERVLMTHVRQATHVVIKGEWFNARKEGEKIVSSQYIAKYEGIEVKVDPVSKENYIDTPAEYVSLPKDMGIQRVDPQTNIANLNKAMVPIPTNGMDIFGPLAAGKLESRFGFIPRREKIYFTRTKGKTLKDYSINKVDVDLVVISPIDVDPDDPYPIPPELEQVIIQETIKLLGIQTMPDLINDNNPVKMSK